jgi:hypothetical protein
MSKARTSSAEWRNLSPVFRGVRVARSLASLLKAVAEVDDAAAESVLVDELEILAIQP